MSNKYKCLYCNRKFNKFHPFKKHVDPWNVQKYKYTKTWFLQSELFQALKLHVDPNQKLSMLEIGSFEGLSSCFFSDKLLNDSESSLICVDPYIKSGTVEGITTMFVDDKTQKTFLGNVKKSLNPKKIRLFNETSDKFFEHNKKTFDFIYIDGCHEIEYVKRDIENSYKFLNKGGILWLDDYRCSKGLLASLIDKIINKLQNIKIIHKNYQIAFKKL